jgi:hypothetical protein
MSSVSSGPHPSAVSSIENVAEPIDAHTAALVLKEGPRGALVLACI